MSAKEQEETIKSIRNSVSCLEHWRYEHIRDKHTTSITHLFLAFVFTALGVRGILYLLPDWKMNFVVAILALGIALLFEFVRIVPQWPWRVETK